MEVDTLETPEKPKYKLITYNGHNEKFIGKMVRQYQDGSIRDANGHFIEKHPDTTPITSDNAHEYARMRKEKTQRLLREQILAQHNSSMPDVAGDAPEVFAMSGAMLYEQVVINDKAYPGDRMDAWEKLGKYADVLPGKDDKQDNTPQIAQATAFVGELRGLLDDVINARNGYDVDNSSYLNHETTDSSMSDAVIDVSDAVPVPGDSAEDDEKK